MSDYDGLDDGTLRAQMALEERERQYQEERVAREAESRRWRERDEQLDREQAERFARENQELRDRENKEEPSPLELRRQGVSETPLTEGEHPDGFSESTSEQSVHNFLMTTEGIELAEVFPRIKSAKHRRKILELVRTLSEDQSQVRPY